MSDGSDFPSVVAAQRLEREADALLAADAKARCSTCDGPEHDDSDHEFTPWIRSNGRGIASYHRAHGLTSPKILKGYVYAHEAVGFTAEQLDSLSQTPYDRRSTRPTPTE